MDFVLNALVVIQFDHLEAGVGVLTVLLGYYGLLATVARACRVVRCLTTQLPLAWSLGAPHVQSWCLLLLLISTLGIVVMMV